MKMVRDIDADAVLLTQLVSLRSVGTGVDMNPESTVNLRQTGYWNVFSIDTTEYVEPQAVEFEHSLVLKTDLFSVQSEDTVWGIESRSRFELGFDQARDNKVFVNEERAIVSSLAGDGIIDH